MISSTARPSSRCSPASRRRICACTVTSSAVVGSSAISSCGPHISAMAIITRCRSPPESWCGNWPMRSRRGDADAAQQRGRAVHGRALAAGAVPAPGLGQLRADGVGRVEAGHRLLEDHRHPVAAQPGQGAAGRHRRAVEPQGARGPRAARQQAHDGQRGERLAGAGLADQAVRLPRLHRQRDAAHRLGAREGDAQAVDLQHRLITPRRSPSPSRLMPSTSTNSATPGMVITQGEKNM